MVTRSAVLRWGGPGPKGATWLLMLVLALVGWPSARASGLVPPGGMRRLAERGIGSIYCAALDPQGKTVAVGDTRGRVALVDLGSGKALWQVQAHRGEAAGQPGMVVQPHPADPPIGEGPRGADSAARRWVR